jgi:hypothetical protein
MGFARSLPTLQLLAQLVGNLRRDCRLSEARSRYERHSVFAIYSNAMVGNASKCSCTRHLRGLIAPTISAQSSRH